MLLLSKLHPKLTLNEAKNLIKNYPNKNSFEVKTLEESVHMKYLEKTGQLTTKFEVNFFKGRFATINGFIPLEKCTEDYFNKLKEAYDLIKSTVESIYGKPYSSNDKFKTYAELKKANPSANMTSGRPDDRYENILETTWKIKTDYASLGIILDYYEFINLSFYYAVQNPFG